MSLACESSPIELFVETHMRSEDAKGRCNSSLTTVLNTSWYVRSTIYFVSYYFLELNMMISFLIFRRHIIAGWGRDTGTILRPTQISIWICGWRHNRLVNPIKIVCTDSPTVQSITYGRHVVSQPLGAPNQSEEIVALKQQYQQLSADYEQLC